MEIAVNHIWSAITQPKHTQRTCITQSCITVAPRTFCKRGSGIFALVELSKIVFRARWYIKTFNTLFSISIKSIVLILVADSHVILVPSW